MRTKQINELSRIAVYLRKSREDKDTDDTLAKHRKQLEEYVQANNLKVKPEDWFEEIESADSISKRPIFSELLEKVEAGAFNAVLVVAFDRLTRGSMKDAGLVIEAFVNSDTYILTPNKLYDLSEDSSLLLTEIESLFARQEYRTIKQRLRQGKINGVKQGKLTNGKPPFPYEYDRNTKTVKVNEEKRKIYDIILKMFLNDDMSTEEIATYLNVKNIPTIMKATKRYPNPVWRQSQVARILKGDFHLGYVYYGKYKRTKDKLIKNEPNGVVKVKGLHEPLKTEEQHALILKKFDETRLLPNTAKKGTYALMGLVKCAFCGGTISWTKAYHKGEDADKFIYLKKCRKRLADGKSRCNKNTGSPEFMILETLRVHMQQYREDLFAKSTEENINKPKSNALLAIQLETIEKATASIERIKDLYIDGEIDRKEFEKRKALQINKIQTAQAEVERIKQSNDLIDEVTKKERLRRWEEIELENLFNEDLDIKERNEGFKKLIERIEYKRVNDEIEIEVFFK